MDFIILALMQKQLPGSFSVKKMFLKIYQKSKNKTCARVTFFNNLQASDCNSIKKATLTQVFSREFWEIFKNTSGGCFYLMLIWAPFSPSTFIFFLYEPLVFYKLVSMIISSTKVQLVHNSSNILYVFYFTDSIFKQKNS